MGEPGPSGESFPAQPPALTQFEDAICRARAQLEEYAAAWIEDLTSARAGQPQEIDKRSRERLAEAQGRLERLCEALRGDRAPLEASGFASSAPRTVARAALERKVDEHERAERALAAANVALLHRIADRKRLEEERRVAGALRHRMRQTDVLARLGGDEFAALLPEADADQAQSVAEGIVKTLSQHVAVLGEQSIRATASIGVALFDGLSAAEVLAFADLSMYEAKQAGRNRVAVYRASGEHREREWARKRSPSSSQTARPPAGSRRAASTTRRATTSAVLNP